jgi:hypothetical protein
LRESSFRTATGRAAPVEGFFFVNKPTIRLRRKYAAAARTEANDCRASNPDPGSTYALAGRSVANKRQTQTNSVTLKETNRFIESNP